MSKNKIKNKGGILLWLLLIITATAAYFLLIKKENMEYLTDKISHTTTQNQVSELEVIADYSDIYEVIRILKKELTWCLGIDTNFFPLSASGYHNNERSVSLMLPSVDTDGRIITKDKFGSYVPVGTYIDYVYLYLENNELKMETFVSSEAPSPLGRINGIKTIADNIKYIYISSEHVSLSKYESSQMENLKMIKITLKGKTKDNLTKKVIDKKNSAKIIFRKSIKTEN
ncbi:MAG: hypothetical protein ACD_79C01091G0003 [uncultured bacterium]|nr:MAG: hypothetical protein ACD_79C01091G0003 [uncultured bacterium]